MGFGHFFPGEKKCAARQECEGARALELMDAGGANSVLDYGISGLLVALVFDCGSGLFWARFAGYDASYAEFPLVVGRTGIIGILDGMYQKGPLCGDALRLFWQWHVQGLFC